MQRRCIICGEEPCGYYVYPRTLSEARKWQDWANLYSFNVPAGTLRKHGCVCQKHLEAVDELEKTEDKDGEVIGKRSVGGIPTPIRGSDGLFSYEVPEQEKRPSVSFTDSVPNQRKSFQQQSRCCCPDQQITLNQYQSKKQRKERNFGSTKSSSSVLRIFEKELQPNVCYCPATTQIPHFQYDPSQTLKYDPSHAWYMNQVNQQQQQQQHQEKQQTTMEQQKKHEHYQKQQEHQMQQRIMQQHRQMRQQNCRKSSETLLGRSASRSLRSFQQCGTPECCSGCHTQSRCCQCSLKVSNRDQQLQCPSQVYRHQKCRQFTNPPVPVSLSSVAASEINCDPNPVTCERGTTTSQNQVNVYDNFKAKTKRKVHKLRRNPNAVNVLIMGAFGQRRDETGEACPATFQPSPLTEICLLESGLTKTNERAIFPDIDLPNYLVCRAPTTDPNTDEAKNNKTNHQDENCADVLVLGKGLQDIDPCPCNCEHCLFDMNSWNCPYHTKPDGSSQLGQKNEAAAESQLIDRHSLNLEAQVNNNHAITEQRARIDELKILLDQHNILQQSIQSKVDELQSNIPENDSKPSTMEKKPMVTIASNASSQRK